MRSDQKSCPVQLPLAVSGWGFKEEFSTAAVKVEKVEDAEPMETNVEGNYALDIFTIFDSFSDNVFGFFIIFFRLVQKAHCQ